jgi:hypothetical protein
MAEETWNGRLGLQTAGRLGTAVLDLERPGTSNVRGLGTAVWDLARERQGTLNGRGIWNGWGLGTAGDLELPGDLDSEGVHFNHHQLVSVLRAAAAFEFCIYL